jgi:hypothetical protein
MRLVPLVVSVRGRAGRKPEQESRSRIAGRRRARDPCVAECGTAIKFGFGVSTHQDWVRNCDIKALAKREFDGYS